MTVEGEWAMQPGSEVAVEPGPYGGVEARRLRVALCAEVPLVLQGLLAVLERCGSIDVVGSAPHFEALLDVAERTTPEILVVHVGVGSRGDMDRLATLRREAPRACLVVLFSASAATQFHSLLQSPANVLLPDDEVSRLEEILRDLRPGCRYVAPRIIEHLQEGKGDEGAGKNRLDCLTPREREILRRIVKGEGSKEIAAYLGIRPRTVDAHRASMMKKLNIHKVTGLVRLAVQHGLAQDP